MGGSNPQSKWKKKQIVDDDHSVEQTRTKTTTTTISLVFSNRRGPVKVCVCCLPNILYDWKMCYRFIPPTSHHLYSVLYIAAAAAAAIIFIIACERRSKASTTMTAPSVKKETNRKSHSRRSSLCRVRDVAVCVRSKCSLLSRCLTLCHVFGHDPTTRALFPAVLSIPTHNGKGNRFHFFLLFYSRKCPIPNASVIRSHPFILDSNPRFEPSNGRSTNRSG